MSQITTCLISRRGFIVISLSWIRVVYSTEVPGEVKLLPLPDEEYEKGAVHELGVLDDFRVRILPVLGKFHSSVARKSD